MKQIKHQKWYVFLIFEFLFVIFTWLGQIQFRSNLLDMLDASNEGLMLKNVTKFVIKVWLKSCEWMFSL